MGRSLPAVWAGPLLDPSGYSDEARGFLCSLERCGYDVAARQFGFMKEDAGLPQQHVDIVRRALKRPAPDGDFVYVHHHQPADGQPLHANGPDVARTMFETDRIPRMWQRRLLEIDEIWVPAAFNVETFQRGGIPGDRLHLLPGTLDFDIFSRERAEPLPLPEGARGFTFLSTFDFTDRKGWDVLLDAWAQAFQPDDDVSLVLKCLTLHGVTEAGIRERIETQLGRRRTAPIVLDTRLLPTADLARLYAAADAFVLSSRSEGWGRPLMEAMAMGLPTIGTRWSGNLAFMDDRNSWLADGEVVDIDQWYPVHPSLWQGGRWFAPDVDSVSDKLVEVYRGGPAVRERAAFAAVDLRERFGAEVIAQRVVELVEGALERWQWRRSRPVACLWRGEFGSGHSLAIVNDRVIEALESAGLQVDRTAPASGITVLDVPGIAQHWPPSFDPPTSGPFVLYQPWEFGRIPAAWVDKIRRTVDQVWTPSEYSKRAYVESGVSEEIVRVLPNGVDLATFTPDGPRRSLPTTKSTVFLYVGGAIQRKGIDVLLHAYGLAFERSDDVCLAIKGVGSQGAYKGQTEVISAIEAFAAVPDAPELLFLDDDVPFAELPDLYRAADVLVQPYRGEGFCLPALEALACGLPLIVTAGGPTDEFASDACAWRIPARQVPLPADALPVEFALVDGGFLLEPSVDALVAALREAADPGLRAVRAATARAHAEPLGWEQVGAIAQSHLADLAGQTPVRRLSPAVVPGRRRVLFAADAVWDEPDTWARPLRAYAAAFTQADETTLVLPALDERAATSLVLAELAAAGIDPAALADVVLAHPGELGFVSLELAADAIVVGNGHRPLRARSIVPSDPTALRAVMEVLG